MQIKVCKLYQGWLWITLLLNVVNQIAVGGILVMQFSKLPLSFLEVARLEASRIALFGLGIVGIVIIVHALGMGGKRPPSGALTVSLYCFFIVGCDVLARLGYIFAEFQSLLEILWTLFGGIIALVVWSQNGNGKLVVPNRCTGRESEGP